MKTYYIPVTYTVWGLVPIKASSLEDAIVIQETDSKLPPDTNTEYVMDSEEIDFDSIIEHNNELSGEDVAYLRDNH